jgi:hypothetical protein
MGKRPLNRCFKQAVFKFLPIGVDAEEEKENRELLEGNKTLGFWAGLHLSKENFESGQLKWAKQAADEARSKHRGKPDIEAIKSGFERVKWRPLVHSWKSISECRS